MRTLTLILFLVFIELLAKHWGLHSLLIQREKEAFDIFNWFEKSLLVAIIIIPLIQDIKEISR